MDKQETQHANSLCQGKKFCKATIQLSFSLEFLSLSEEDLDYSKMHCIQNYIRILTNNNRYGLSLELDQASIRNCTKKLHHRNLRKERTSEVCKRQKWHFSNTQENSKAHNEYLNGQEYHQIDLVRYYKNGRISTFQW